jgi:hypothetical protein
MLLVKLSWLINTIIDELHVTFVSLRLIVYPAILGAYLPFWFKISGEVHLQVHYKAGVTWVWTKFWNVTLLKIILFSPTLSITLACTHRHEIIPFHNLLWQDIQWIIFPCHVCCKSSFSHEYFLAIDVVHTIPLAAIKTHSCWRFRNTYVETSTRKKGIALEFMHVFDSWKLCALHNLLRLFWMYFPCRLSRDIIHRY